MKTRCSHVLLWVRDIHRAVGDYRQLGFTVNYATNPDKAQHAHIWFSSGPVIELLTTPKSARFFKWPIEWVAGRGSGRRMLRWPAGGEGFCDVAVATDTPELAPELVELRRAGVPVGRAIPWARTTPAGQRIRFSFAYPENDRLPFIVTPYEPPQHPRDAAHRNGARRLSRVTMGVRREDGEPLRQLIGDDPTFLLQSADVTGVLGIELLGLQAELDPSLLHGALVRPTSGERDSPRADGGRPMP
jgi:hypothetical protein